MTRLLIERWIRCSGQTRGASLVKRMNGVNIVDFNDVLALYSGVPPHRKLSLLFLLLALKDRASELQLEPWMSEPDGYRLRLFYDVNGQIHEFSASL